MATDQGRGEGRRDVVLNLSGDLEALWEEQPASPPATGSREFERALSACDFPLVIWDVDGCIRLANQLVADLVGVPLEDIVGHHLFDFVLPLDATTKVVEGIASGTHESLRSKITVTWPGREDVPVWVWTRAIELDGSRGAVTLIVPGNEVGRLGRDTLVPWRDLVPVAVGVADSEWRIEGVSADIVEVVGRAPADCTGSSLLALVHPKDVPRLCAPRWELSGQVMSRSGVRLAHRDGSWVETCVLAAGLGAGRPGDVIFALVGAPHPGTAPLLDRAQELELHLRRIAAEVRAAGLLDGVAGFPAPSDHPQLQELSSRQWEILSRLLRGQRVPTIAGQLFLSQSTVRNHLAAIFRKFGVHSQAELLEVLRQHRKAG